MAAIIGNDGNLTQMAAHAGQILDSWRANIINSVVEVTGFGDSTNRRNRGGLINLDGSASGTPDDTATNEPGAGAVVAAGEAITLTMQSGNTWAFTAVIRNITLEATKAGGTRVSFDFTIGDVSGADSFVEAWT